MNRVPEARHRETVIALGYPGKAKSLPEPLYECEWRNAAANHSMNLFFRGDGANPASITAPAGNK